MKTRDEVARNEVKLNERVAALQKELASVKRAADAAQGVYPLRIFALFIYLTSLQKGSVPLRKTILL